jgi:hypothetical protein
MFVTARNKIKCIAGATGMVLLFITAACKKENQAITGTPTKMEIIPASDTLRRLIASNTLLTASHPWYIDGWVYVSNEASLRIEAGTIIKVLPTAVNTDNGRCSGGLVITRGASIHAVGTVKFPIHFMIADTVNVGGSGVIVLGRAPQEKKNMITDNPETPALSNLAYGGDVADDSSGSMEHVYIDYYVTTDKGFTGGLLLMATGSKTVIRNITKRPLLLKHTLLKRSGLH